MERATKVRLTVSQLCDEWEDGGLWVVNPTRGAAFTQSADELQHPHPLTLLGLFYDKLLVLTKYQVGRYRCLK